MIKYFLSLFILPSLLLAQELNNDWLDITLDKERSLVIETTIETFVKDKEKEKINNTYFTIQIAAKATFSDAEEVVKILNNYNFEAFIQKNDSNEKLKYRVRYGSFLSKEDASSTAKDIKNELGYDCWVDKIEL